METLVASPVNDTHGLAVISLEGVTVLTELPCIAQASRVLKTRSSRRLRKQCTQDTVTSVTVMLDAGNDKTGHLCAAEQQQCCSCTGIHSEAMHGRLDASHRVQEHLLTGPDPAE